MDLTLKNLPIPHGVPRGSVLGPLLFLLYINEIKFCKAHHFADDISLLHISKSIKKLNKFVNFDLKNCQIGLIPLKYH